MTWRNRQLGLLALCLAGAPVCSRAAAAQSLFPRPSPPFLLSIAFAVSIVLVIFVAAVGIGSAILHLAKVRFRRRRYQHFTAAALGMGVIGQLMVLIGLLGWFKRGILTVLIALSIVATLKYIGRFFQDVAQFAAIRLRWRYRPIEIILLTAICIVCLTYFSLSLLAPVSYDVLEYHLSAPRDFLRAGKITAQPYNFFANLALHVEMLYTLGMALEGGFIHYAPKLLNCALLLLSLCGVYVTMALFAFPLALRLLGSLLFLLNPVIYKISLDAFSDLGVCLYVLAALVVWLAFMESSDRKRFFLIGVFLGFAVSCKYTAFALYVIPFMLSMLPARSPSRSASPQHEQLENTPSKKASHHVLSMMLRAAALLIIVVAILSPWLVKNALLLKNPVYPFFHAMFPSPYWSAEQSEFLVRVHHPQNPLSLSFVKSLVVRGGSVGWLYFVTPLLVLFIARRKDALIIRFLMFFILSYGVWNYLGSSADRFLAGLIPVLTLLIVWAVHKLFTLYKLAPILLCATIALALLSFLYTFLPQGITVFRVPGEEYFFAIHPGFAQAAQSANRIVPPNPASAGQASRLLLIYEARSYPFLAPTACNTVFDRAMILDVADQSRSAEEMLVRLRQQGFTHCLVNEFELVRLIRFYGEREHLRERNVEQHLDNDSVLVNYREFYPPFDRSPRYPRNAIKIADFFRLLDDRIVFALKSPSGLRIFIASLEGGA